VSEVPSEEQARLARDLAEELRKLRVEDVLVNTLMHVSSIGYRRLGASAETRDERDLDQVRLAIETMRALTPVVERFVPGDLLRDFNSSVANLQLAYATAATEARAAGEPAPAEAAGEPSEPPRETPAEQEPPTVRDEEGGEATGGEAAAAEPSGRSADGPADEGERE
jgi:hypothetical protein